MLRQLHVRLVLLHRNSRIYVRIVCTYTYVRQNPSPSFCAALCRRNWFGTLLILHTRTRVVGMCKRAAAGRWPLADAQTRRRIAFNTRRSTRDGVSVCVRAFIQINGNAFVGTMRSALAHIVCGERAVHRSEHVFCSYDAIMVIFSCVMYVCVCFFRVCDRKHNIRAVPLVCGTVDTQNANAIQMRTYTTICICFIQLFADRFNPTEPNRRLDGYSFHYIRLGASLLLISWCPITTTTCVSVFVWTADMF